MQRLNLTAKSFVPRIVTAAQKSQQCRKMGGGGHGGKHANHGPPVPYAVKHAPDYQQVAYPFGIVPGTPLQGWEIPTFGFYFVGFMITFVGIGYCKKDTTFTVRECGHIQLGRLTVHVNRELFKAVNIFYCCREFFLSNPFTIAPIPQSQPFVVITMAIESLDIYESRFNRMS